MPDLTPGRPVAIPCQVHGGPFPDQRLVRLRGRSGWLDGIVARADLVREDGVMGRLRGEILSADAREVVVAVPKAISGSFFSRSGRLVLDRATAEATLEPLA